MLFKPSLPVLLLCSMAVVVGCDSSSTSSPAGQMSADAGDSDSSSSSGGNSGDVSDSDSMGDTSDGGSGGSGGSGDTGDTGDTGDSGDSGDSDTSGGNGGVTTESQAQYRLTFESSWSPATHPTNFPSGPHFSGVTGATHHGAVSLWQPGQLASEGVRRVAELGKRDTIIARIRESIAAGSAHQLIEGAGVPNSPDSVSVDFEVSQLHPLVTVLSMVAPSPDWMVGVHDLDLRGSDGRFVDSLTVDAIVYDAGTDSGATYVSGDVETLPRAPITRLTSNSGDTDFVDGLPRAGRFIFQKQ